MELKGKCVTARSPYIVPPVLPVPNKFNPYITPLSKTIAVFNMFYWWAKSQLLPMT